LELTKIDRIGTIYNLATEAPWILGNYPQLLAKLFLALATLNIHKTKKESHFIAKARNSAKRLFSKHHHGGNFFDFS